MTKNCGECRYMLHKDTFEVCTHSMTETSMFDEACKHFAPQTNGDKIIAGGMRAIAEVAKNRCQHCIYKNSDYIKTCLEVDCADGIEAWLNAPADCVKQNGKNDTQTDLCKADNTERDGKDEL